MIKEQMTRERMLLPESMAHAKMKSLLEMLGKRRSEQVQTSREVNERLYGLFLSVCSNSLTPLCMNKYTLTYHATNIPYSIAHAISLEVLCSTMEVS